MSKMFFFASLAAVFTVGAMLAGCSKQQASHSSSPSPKATAAPSAGTGHETGPTQAGDAAHATAASRSEYEDALAQLSTEDHALAEKQKSCPVSGQPLGKMGKPCKVTVQGRDVLLCCPGCEAKIKADPDKYLAKLAQ